MELKPLKVKEVNNYIKRIIDGDPILHNISVEGEISNFKHHYTGHMYFTLKDSSSRIRCVMFKSHAGQIQFDPKDGVNVVAKGYISVYDKDGSYQLYVNSMKPKGIGDLFIAFEQLKNKLEKQGLFNKIHKKELPFLPKKVGVVTSSTGAAVRDIITVIKRRLPSANILIYPVLVQGQRAHQEVCKGLKYFDTRDDIDLIITGRGGGSIEELWCFNEEDVAKTIYELSTPIISAVGHETDFTIADFVADLRAPTPSSAGELAVPRREDLMDKLNQIFSRLVYNYNMDLNNKRDKLEYMKKSLINRSPENELKNNREQLRRLYKDLSRNIIHRKNILNKDLMNLGAKLDSLSPLSVLNRGYSLLINDEGHVINSIKEVDIDEKLDVLLHDGDVKVKVLDKKEGRRDNYDKE
ncbi:exodeoxyribonuclease VII large subunit [Dethiothermospora halolimnae]|uniref:exodeoxyribonuclease VII large subunit n=1 Tax=Dethiothermospora halolimnae TaxID=3114390 RepID=UPI003CCC2F21